MESPPELAEQLPRGVGQIMKTVLPLVIGLGGMMFLIFVVRGGATSWVTGGMLAISLLGMAAGSMGGTGADKNAKLDGDRRDYLRHLAQMRKRARKAAAQQRATLLWRHPDPNTLWSIAGSARMWERRPTDDDFGEVRIALGSQRPAVSIVTPDTKPLEDLEPVTALALRRFVRAHSTVPGLPVALSLRAFSRVVLRGDREASLDLVRSIVGELATFHPPDDLFVAVVTASQRRAEWEWVKWLPHAQFGGRTDAAGAVRLVVGTESDLESSLGEELAGRPRHSPGASPLTNEPHVLVVLDGGGRSMTSSVLGSGALGTTVLDLSGQVPRGAGSWVCLDVSSSAVQLTQGRRTTALGQPDRMSIADAEGLARRLAPFRLSQQVAADEPLSRSMELPDLLGVSDAAAIDPRLTWRRRPVRDQLRVPMGLAPDGGVVELDIKEAAHDGMGPHGLLVGATGSGKSELLRTLVLALAVTHSSEELNFVLVDFKGGATFASLDTSAAHQRGDHQPGGRTASGRPDARRARRRDGASAGAAAGRRQLRQPQRATRGRGSPASPLGPAAQPADHLRRVQRAAGGQARLHRPVRPDRPDRPVARGAPAARLAAAGGGPAARARHHLSYRIGLRTFSAMESRIVLGVPDAYELPRLPATVT